MWWAELDKIRPVVILTRGHVAPLLHRVLVGPVTSRRRDLPTEVLLGASECLEEGSVLSLDNSQLLPVNFLLNLVGRISAERWPEVCRAMAKVIAC